MSAARIFVPRGSPSCLLPSLGGSPRWINVSNPGSFQISASALSLAACEILCVLFKSQVSILLQPFSSLVHKPCCPSKLDSMGAHLRSAACQDWGPPCGDWIPHSLGRISEIVIIFPLVVCLTGVRVLTILQLYPSYPSYCGSFFISLVVENLFC